MKKINLSPIVNPLLAVCMLILTSTFGCKKGEELLPKQLKAVSTTKPIGALATEHYNQLTENVKYRSLLNELAAIGYVDWEKMVVDLSGDYTRPFAYVFPVYRNEQANDLLVFQYSESKELSEIHLLHYDVKAPDAKADEERLKQKFLYVLSKQGVNIAEEIIQATEASYLKTKKSIGNPQVTKKIAEIKSTASKTAVKVDRLLQPAQFSSNTTGATCGFIGQWHWVVVLNTWDNTAPNLLASYRATFLENLMNYGYYYYNIGFSMELSSQNMAADVSSLVGDASLGSYANVVDMLSYVFNDMVGLTTMQTNIAITVYSVTFDGYLSCYGGVVIDVPPTDPPTDPQPGGGGDGEQPTTACQQDADAQLQAQFDAHTAFSSPEQSQAAYEIPDGGETYSDPKKWIVAEGATWEVFARTRITIEYPLPLNPDKYLRNKMLTLQHMESDYDGTNIFVTTTWAQSGHTENYTNNNTPHPRGDARVWGKLHHVSTAEINIDFQTPCGNIKAKIRPTRNSDADNTLHVLM